MCQSSGQGAGAEANAPLLISEQCTAGELGLCPAYVPHAPEIPHARQMPCFPHSA